MWFAPALLSASAWGTGDFLGGLASRRSSALSVLILSTPFGLAAITVAVLWDGWTSEGALPALLAGVCLGVGLTNLYSALSIGPMNVVAPASAVVGASVPVVAGLAQGERPGPMSMLGIVVALTAVVLVSREPEQAAAVDAQTSISGRSTDPVKAQRSGLGLAVFAGLGIGASLVLLERAAGDAVNLAPLLPSRLAVWATVILIGLGTRSQLLAAPGARLFAVGAGLLDGAANVCYVLALRGGPLTVVGVIVSLYPAVTVLLARVVLGERTSRVQNLGLLLAAAGVVLMVVG